MLHHAFVAELNAGIGPACYEGANRFLIVYQACLDGNQNLTRVMKILVEHDENKLRESNEGPQRT
ncbi:hypothetical protein TorRG33x02_249250 [Trema orientale]|uniref:Uncharacterized protein n=1 Tax=Trema orientale TaxID=63057 RepID=A0A2P5DJG1_TREOI|nr:hypothetical protein TorRG33x02_249250 [Trema orientale]